MASIAALVRVCDIDLELLLPIVHVASTTTVECGLLHQRQCKCLTWTVGCVACACIYVYHTYTHSHHILKQLIIMLVGNFISYIVRNVPTSFQEGTYVNIAMLCQLQLFAVVVPALVAVYESPEGRFFVIAGLILVCCLCLFSVIFGPKIIAFYRGDKDEEQQVCHERQKWWWRREGWSCGYLMWYNLRLWMQYFPQIQSFVTH